MSFDNYQCTLSDSSIKKAKEELNEDPKERAGAVQAFREWTEREPWIRAPTDTTFLLAFLRTSKFSQLKARERLGNLLSHFKKHLQYIVGHDPGDPKSLDIIRAGSYIILPGKDKEGRGVFLTRASAIPTEKCTYNEYMRAMLPLFHSLMFMTEEVQVNGLTFLVDFGGVNMGLITWMGLENMRLTADFINKAFPARIKGLNYYNTGPVFEAFIGIMKPLLSPKLRSRIHVHHTMVSVYDMIDLSVLPDEYLPDDYTGPSAGKLTDIIENNIKEFILDPNRRTFLKDLYSGIYSADLTKKPTETEATASFRKLNVS